MLSTCAICSGSFTSRNKLFIHINEVHKVILRDRVDAVSEVEVLSNLEERIVTVKEDDWYRVIIKPQGLATMGTKGYLSLNLFMHFIYTVHFFPHRLNIVEFRCDAITKCYSTAVNV